MGYLDEPIFIELRRLKQTRVDRALTEQDFIESARRIVDAQTKFGIPKDEEGVRTYVNILKDLIRY